MKKAQHANQFGHSMDFDSTTIVDKGRDYHRRLFLQAWHSQRDQNAGNEHYRHPRHLQIVCLMFVVSRSVRVFCCLSQTRTREM